MRKSVRKLAVILLVLSLLVSDCAFGLTVKASAEELVKDSVEDVKSPEDIEDCIESGEADIDDFETKAVGSDGKGHENVEYLSVGVVSRLEEEDRHEYYSICDQIAEDIDNGVEADVVIAVDPEGELEVFALLTADPIAVDLVSSDLIPENTSKSVDGKKDDPVYEGEESDSYIEDAVDEENVAETATISDPERSEIFEENTELLAEMDQIEEEEIEVTGEVFDVTNVNRNYFRDQLTANGKIIFDSVCYAAQNGNNTASVSIGMVSLSDISRSVSAALNTYVKAFEWMDASRSISYSSTSTCTTVKFAVSGYYSKTLETQAQNRAKTIAKRAREYAYEKRPSDIPYGIIEYINAWVCQFNYYNYDGQGNGDKTSETFYRCHSSYGVLLSGYGVCESYAKATSRILDCAGIRNLYAVGYTNRGSHAWNCVYLNGTWYVLDTTWNDAGDRETKDYFLVGGSQAAYEGRRPNGRHYVCSDFGFPDISSHNYNMNTQGVYDPSPEPEPADLANPVPEIRITALPNGEVLTEYSMTLLAQGLCQRGSR